MIKVSKLWGDGLFQSLTTEAKLLYLHLATNPSLSTLGIVRTTADQIKNNLNYEKETAIQSSLELKNKKYVHVFKIDDITYFLILDHLNTLSNSQSVINKLKKEYETLDDRVKEELLKIGVNLSTITKKFDKFIVPTPEEVEAYAISLGHMISGEQVIEHYQKDGNKWVDARGKRVLDWKAKVRKVWCREDNKIPKGKDAPKGFEYFFVKSGDSIIFATHWVKGEPRSKEGLVGDKKLNEKYNKSKL